MADRRIKKIVKKVKKRTADYAKIRGMSLSKSTPSGREDRSSIAKTLGPKRARERMKPVAGPRRSDKRPGTGFKARLKKVFKKG
ncbi:MAG: hypothetical protein ACPGO0_00120 [Acidimicrobiales bacterium]